jgi:hypothetical protein
MKHGPHTDPPALPSHREPAALCLWPLVFLQSRSRGGGRASPIAASPLAAVPMADRHAVARWLLIGALASLAGIWCQVAALDLPPADLLPPVALLLALTGLTAWYARRGEAAFVLSLTSLAQVVAFAACYIVLMYAAAALNRPLADEHLAAFDAWCGVTAPAVRGWAQTHPWANLALNFAYDTLLWQTAAVIAVLGLTGDRRTLEGFVWAFMLSATASLVLFAIFPANGPFVTFGFPPSANQRQFLEHFEALRDGQRTLVTWRGAEGLITFPSFHVAWAIVLAWAFRRRKLIYAIAPLNLLVIVSTMSTGWHYFADMLGGTAVASGAIAVTHFARRDSLGHSSGL